MNGTLPTAVIGGYLAAGKTTLINHLLRHAGGRRVAVLVNDFGDVNIDAELIEGSSGDVLSLAGGCLCCSFGDDLLGTLAALQRRAPPPEVCLIELSGVALPAAVVRTARLARGVEITGTLVVADAAEVRRQAADRYVGDTVRQQLRDADWLLLNKPDLVDAQALTATAAWLSAQAPQARLWSGTAASLLPELLLGWRAMQSSAFASRSIAAARPAANSLFESRSVALPAGTDLQALGAALAAPNSGVLRAKGLARDMQGRGRLLQVAGSRWAVTPVAVHGPGRLVLIGLRKQWDPMGLERLLAR